MEWVYLASLDETWLKSSRTKSFFLEVLISNIRKVFPNAYIVNDLGKLVLKGIDDRISNVFGIKKIIKAVRVNKKENKILEAIDFLIENYLRGEFKVKVEVNRADKSFPIKSIDFAKKLAIEIFRSHENLKPDLKNFDVKIRESRAIIKH